MKKLFLALLFICASNSVALADAGMDFSSFSEVQKIQVREGRLRMLWLLPTELFKIVYESQVQNASQEERALHNQILLALDEYTIFMVVDKKLEQTLTLEAPRRFAMLINNGEWIAPANASDLPVAMNVVLAGMKRAVIRKEDQSRETQIIVFPARGSDGKKLFSYSESANVSLQLDDGIFTWNLPLPSLAKNMNGESGTSFPPDYLYNPYTGEKLK